jgi:hypothetical protein
MVDSEQWRAHVLDRVQRGQATRDVLNRRSEGRIAHGQRAALNQHLLIRGLRELVVQHLLGAPRLANTIKPRIAALRCSALHLPARAATLLRCTLYLQSFAVSHAGDSQH